MHTDDLMHRLRSYFLSKGMNARQVAIAAGVHWRTANRLLSGDGNLTLDSVRQIEAAVPPDFEPDTPTPTPRRKRLSAPSAEGRAA